MYRRNVSGQFLYFGMVSALSGNSVGGISGAISGSRSIDGGVRTLLSGDIIDVSNGQYCARLYDFDLNGNQVGFYFSASGCIPVSFTVVTDNNVSGRIGIVSGTSVNVWSGQLSGQTVTPTSGAFGMASLNSGQFVLVYSGQLSGQQVTAAAPASGTTWLASGHSVTLYSGQSVIVNSGQLSGQLVTPASGASVVDRNFIFMFDFAQDGLITTDDRVIWLAYLATVNAINSGIASGQIQLASGHPATLYSGQSVIVNSGQLSGQLMTPASGAYGIASLNSGQFTSPYSGQMSGQPVTPTSGTTWLASGHQAALYSGQMASLYSGSVGLSTFQSGGTELADVYLRRPFASGGPVLSGQRNLIYGARKLTNKWDLQAASGYLVVYTENDTTEAYRVPTTPVSGAAPLAELG